MTRCSAMQEAEIEHAALMFLVRLGIDTDHPDFLVTHERMARMYINEVCAGLFTDPPPLTRFPKPDGMDQMITVGPITVHSLCPHHFAPILGKAWVGVVPRREVLGLSKYARLVHWCAARPIMQETLTEMVADYLEKALDPLGLGVVIKAEHLCMSWRGVRQPGALTTTSAVRGVFRSEAGTRAEFMEFIR